MFNRFSVSDFDFGFQLMEVIYTCRGEGQKGDLYSEQMLAMLYCMAILRWAYLVPATLHG